ncbi:hypothetical protein, partial [Brachybacterium alimentarium]|uniref:hypothetical protein n=1 Tax=Brachybacterium alimentarium TaxID=47845 RepID=UPI003FD476F1
MLIDHPGLFLGQGTDLAQQMLMELLGQIPGQEHSERGGHESHGAVCVPDQAFRAMRGDTQPDRDLHGGDVRGID